MIKKSISSYVFLLSLRVISWSLKKQLIVTISTINTNFVVTTSYACQVVWLKRILKMFGKKQNIPTISHYDNSSTIKLAKNLVMYRCNKYISVRFHFLYELTKAGTIEMVHCNNQNQVADVMTKPLKLDAFLKL